MMGLKHLHDKRKYKPKAKSGTINVVPKSKPKRLDSNWDRYEEEESDDFELESSTDFALLANNPIIKGSHFQFRSDKYDFEVSKELPGDIFNLDMNLLNLSLSSLPFYEFIPDKQLFSESQIHTMDIKASEGIKEYNKYWEKLRDKNQTHLQHKCLIDEDTLNTFEKQIENLDIVSSNADTQNKSKKDLTIAKKENKSPSKDVSMNKDPDDLETWLDDILDQ